MSDSDSQPKSTKPKKRVSHRKELAVVTLAMVASISGVGGLLATDQTASSQPAQTSGTAAKPAVTAPAHKDRTGAKPVRIIPSSRGGDEGGERDDGGGRHAMVRAAKVNHRNTAPSFSAHPHRSSSAVSQGSTPVG